MQMAMNPQMGRDLNVTDSVLRPLFSNLSVILLLLMPLVTMRLFAEERRSGTIELLLTYPVRDGAVLVGKYLAALTLYGVMLARHAGLPGHAHVLHAGGVGAAAHRLPRACCSWAAMFLAVGLFASSLTENQIVAAIVTFGVLLMFWIIGWSGGVRGRPHGRPCSRTCRSSSTTTPSPRACSTRRTSSTT